MPLYDYRCEKCDFVKEYWFKSSEMPDKVPCGADNCDGLASYQPSFNYCSSAQNFSPVVIHRDAQGNVRFPGRTDAPVPEGFTKVELTNIHQIRRFEKETSQRDAQTAGEFQSSRQIFLDGQLRENRKVLDAIRDGATWTTVDPITNKETIHRGMSDRGKGFLDAMRKASLLKQAEGRRPSNPAFFIEAFSNDSSNRDQYFDERQSHGRRLTRR